MFKNILLSLSIIGFVCACRQQPQNIQEQFTGRWVASYFLDSLSLSNISTIPFGATEISISPTSAKDGITFWNEDVEGNWILPATWHGDTLVTMFDNEISNRMLIKNGQLLVTFRDITVSYHPIDSSLINQVNSLDMTVVRLLINRVMSQQTFTDEATGKTVQFKENGQVSGLNDFIRYTIAIAGDNANIDDGTSITFFNINGVMTKWGMKGDAKKVGLYTLRLLTESDEKPWYETDNIAHTLWVIPKTGH